MPEPNLRSLVSVILAAGRGTRMQSPHLPKVCHPILGRPAITRSIETYHDCGTGHHLVVVGPQAEQVIEAASQASASLSFCTQEEPKGTGHAARVAASYLKTVEFEGEVLVVAGDKVVDKKALLRLIDSFYNSQDDLTFLVGETNRSSLQGRVMMNEQGAVRGIVETPDIARVRLLQELRAFCQEGPVPADQVRKLAEQYFSPTSKAATALRPIWEEILQGREVDRSLLSERFDPRDFTLHLQGQTLCEQDLDRAKYSNLSVYLFRSEAFYFAVEQLTADNAQGEEYLTDTVEILRADDRPVKMLAIEDPHDVMAFNTPEELRAIEAHVARRNG